jgi:hypothetical protein
MAKYKHLNRAERMDGGRLNGGGIERAFAVVATLHICLRFETLDMRM